MKTLVFGGNGKMGAAVAWDLAKELAVDVIGLVGRRRDALEQTRAWLKSPKVHVHAVDIADRSAGLALMKQYHVGILTLPDRRTSYLVADTAIEAGLNFVDMLEAYHRAPDAYETENLVLPAGMKLEEYGEWLLRRAIENNVTFMDGIGFAPGISNDHRRRGHPQARRGRVGHRARGRYSVQGGGRQAPAEVHDHLGLLARAAGIHDQGQRAKGRSDRRD